MSDNPFAEPDDSDRTVFIPQPGGRKPPSPPPAPSAGGDNPFAAAPAPPPGAMRGAGPQMGAASLYGGGDAAASVQGPAELAVGATPLLAAAAPLLQLLARMRNTVSAPDPGDLRARAAAELRRFEQTGRDGGVPIELLRPAHFALCAALDDVALATPWGAQGAWADASLVSAFHQQVRSGAEFFALLKKIAQAPGQMLPVLELMYMCLSLGFQGQYRLSPRGPAELDELRAEIFALIARQRGTPAPDLSAHWQGIDAPYRPSRAELPVWVVGSAALALIAGVYAWSAISLGTASDAAVTAVQAEPPARMPDISRAAPVVAPPPPVDPGALDRLRAFLQPEIRANQVAVTGTEAVPLIRINNKGMFASGSAVLQPSVHALLTRIGEALKTEPGPVTVAGYTDNQPIRSIKYPSNFELSRDRAEAAAAVIIRGVGDAGRVTAVGHGEADPVESNDTPSGREANRRIEVILRRQG